MGTMKLVFSLGFVALLLNCMFIWPGESHKFPCGGKRKKNCKKFDHCHWKRGRCRFNEAVHASPIFTLDTTKTTYLLIYSKSKPFVNPTAIKDFLLAATETALAQTAGISPYRVENLECSSVTTFIRMTMKYRSVSNINGLDRNHAKLLRTTCIRITGVAFEPNAEFGAIQRSILAKAKTPNSPVYLVHSIHADAEGVKERQRPNIVLMLADDLGYGDVGYQTSKMGVENLRTPYGATPRLNALSKATGSVVFDRYYTSPICGPARYSILSGRQPIRECFERNILFAEGGRSSRVAEIQCIKSLPTYLKQAGYETFHAGKWHVSKIAYDTSKAPDAVSTPGENGFDEWTATESLTPTHKPNCGCFPWDRNACDMGLYGEKNGYFNYIYSNYPLKFFSEMLRNTFECTPYYQGTATGKAKQVRSLITKDDSVYIVDKFEEFISKKGRAQTPFYAQLWFHAPHAPYVCSSHAKRHLAEKLLNSLPPRSQNSCGWVFDQKHIFRFKGYPQSSKTCFKALQNKRVCAELCRRIKIEFYCTILTLDEQVGRVMDLLQDKKLSDNTMVIFTSDNGPARIDKVNRYIGPGSAANLPDSKFSVREGGARVPFLVHYPRMIQSNFRTDIPAAAYDILPTLLDVAGVSVDPTSRDGILDGLSLVPYLTKGVLERYKPIVISNNYNDVHLIYNDVSFVTLQGKSTLQRYNTRSEKLVVQNHRKSLTLKRLYNKLYLDFNSWRARVKRQAPCNVLRLDRNGKCIDNTY